MDGLPVRRRPQSKQSEKENYVGRRGDDAPSFRLGLRILWRGHGRIMGHMIRAVLFDMDGILFDSERAYMEGNLKVLRSLGYTGRDSGLYGVIGKNMDGVYHYFYDLLDHKVPYEDVKRADDQYFVDHPVDFKSIVFPDVPGTVQKLKRDGKILAVCSSSPKDVIDQCLVEIGLAEYFDFAISSDQVDRPKPAPDVYLHAMRVLGLSPLQCIVYEDSADGIAAAKNAGLRVIAREDKRYGQDQSAADWIVKDSTGMYERVLLEDQDGRSVSN